MHKIYTKFYLLAIIVIAAVMTGLYVQYTYFRATLNESAQVVAGESVIVLNEQINGWLIEKAQVIESTGSFLSVKHWNDADTLLYLQALLKKNPAFSSIYFGSTQNDMINASGWKPPPGFDLRTRPWYVKALEESNLIFTEAFVNASKDDLVVTIAKPVFSAEGELLGVVAGDVSVKTIMELVREKKNGENGFSFLVEGNKKILAHPAFQFDLNIGAPILDEEYLKVTQEALQSQSGVIRTYMRGQEGFLAYQRVRHTGWMLGSFISIEDFANKEEQVTRGFFLAVAISIVILLVLFGLLSRVIIAPLVQLNDRVGKIDMDNLSESRISISGNDEIAMVSLNFNKLIDQAIAYLAQMREERKQAEKSHHRSTEIQTVLREIAEAAILAPSLDELYAEVHRLVKRVLPARNFYIALLDESSGQILRPYFVDETNAIPRQRLIGMGLTEYVMHQGKALHLNFAELIRLRDMGKINPSEIPPLEYLGAPLKDSIGKSFGVIALNAIDMDEGFGVEDVEILSIIAAQVSMAIERKRLLDELKYQATTDGLTYIFNRAYFIARADEELQRLQRYGGVCSLLMLDIDYFKNVNDNYGHAVGDTVLQWVTSLCKDVARSSDLLGRIGGEEFALLLVETGIADAMQVAERLRQSIADAEFLAEGKSKISLRVSIGVAEFKFPNESLSELMNRADKALYLAKSEGRNRVVASG